MKKFVSLAAGAALSLAVVGGVVASSAASASASAGRAPAIPVNNGQTGIAEGGGHGKFSYSIAGDQFCYTLDVTGLTAPASAAHVHMGAAGTSGPVRIPFTIPNATSFSTSACVKVSDPAILAGIQANPAGWYVNVHTPTYPSGEVRGQLK